MSVHSEIAGEQRYVSALYERLDHARREAATRLTEVESSETTETDQGMSLRDSLAEHYANRLAQLSTVERGLCFGRIDLVNSDRLYIGRIGLSDEKHDTLLVDWRAPVARTFYQATAAEPHGIRRRRHLHLKDRTVVGLDDDLLDESVLDDTDSLIGEAALLASLRANRTGRLGDIVATIQTEQDEAIRADLPGILVVQGGPGTGKTVVALHRVAYLLYAHRERLARRGALVIGPNSAFLRYIDQVLPSLGETGVVLATVGELFPGVTANAIEPPESAVIKGSLRMVDALRAAVADRQDVPDAPIELTVDDDVLTLTPAVCARARDIARAARDEETRAPLPHNVARGLFAEEVVRRLTGQWVRRLGWADEYDKKELRSLVESAPSVLATVDTLWPNLTPEQFLRDLWSSPERLAAAGFDTNETSLLRRGSTQWTESDVPLLDEAAELLGEDSSGRARNEAREEAAERAEVAYAEGVMQLLGIAESDPVVQAKRAAMLANRYRGGRRRRSAAEHAAGDRTWAFGHIVVDEAQERSAMDWRMIMRRCPSRSMTIVGDFAQAGSAAAPANWAEALDRYAAGNWRVRTLSVNYRTPKSIMELAERVLAEIRPDLRAPRSVRVDGTVPWVRRVSRTELAAAVRDAVAAERSAVGDGQIAIIAPAGLELPEARTVAEVKGLEFDSVILVEPAGIWAGSARGGNDIYVALTRSTRRLGIIHSGQLPAAIRPAARAESADRALPRPG